MKRWDIAIEVDFTMAKALQEEFGTTFDQCWLPWNGKYQTCVQNYGRSIEILWPEGKYRISQKGLSL